MTAFLDDLQRALGAQYLIDRELGGGGMSRVFVAEESALGRMVVLKLLPPELAAAVSAERFRREIQLVARLQHPHIVPVLSAGTANGLLYYTMPFVDGLSLRDRIARDGALSIDVATGIAGEVAGALGYAHSQGLVHRDIKPENVLLSQGHALVTDFGIAKALSQTTGEQPTDSAATPTSALTSIGMSIGTPSYMAPEQGVGDPGTDHRADLYSLGVMLYEMLSGRTPFASRGTPHQLLMAHMMEPPPSLRQQRPEIPAELEALVMACLAKKPEDRPQSGDEIVQALRSGATGIFSSSRTALPRGTTVSGKRARYVWGAMTAAVVAVLGAGAFVYSQNGLTGSVSSANAPGSASATANDRVTVTTFANETGDASLDPVGRMTADWLTTALAGTGLVKVLDARAALGAAGATSDAGNAVKTARELGAGTVVTGSYYKLGDSLQFDVRLIDATTSEVLQVLDPVKGPSADPTVTIELVRQRTLGALATRFNPQLGELARTMSRPPSYAAYQQIVQGMEAFFAQRFPDARARFTQASLIDTASVQARTWLLEVLETTNQLPTADSVARELELRRERLSPLEQAQLDEYTSSIRAKPLENVSASFRMHALAPNGQWRATLARKLMLAHRWQEALDTLVAAPADVGLFRNTPFPLAQHRQLLHRLGRHREELTVAREIARKFNQAPRTQLDIALALAALGEVDSLRPIAERVAAVAPAEVGSWRTLIRAFADEMRWHGHDAAANTLLAGLLADYGTLSPDSAKTVPVLRGRAETLVRMGKWPEAMALVGPAFARDTALATRLSLAIGAAHSGNPAPALELDAVLAAMPAHPYRPGNMLYTRARLAVARGDLGMTMSLLRQANSHAFPVFDGVHASHEFIALRGDSAKALFRP